MGKILIIEDETDLRELIAFNIGKLDLDVIDIDNANDALILIEDNPIDLIILDLMLPGLQGMQFLRLLREMDGFQNTPVVIISAKNSESDIIAALDAGADDYLTKPFSMGILTARINAMLRRTEQTRTSLVEHGGVSIDTEVYKVFVDKQEVRLTKKEYELLLLLIENPRKVFTRNQLLNTIWGYDANSYTRTVDSHVSSLRRKLGDKGSIIKSIPKIGYGIES